MNNSIEGDKSSRERLKFQSMVQEAFASGMDADYLAQGISHFLNKDITPEITPEEVEKWAKGELSPEDETRREQAVRFIRFQIGGAEGNIP